MQEHGFLEVEFYISRLIYSGSFVLCVDIVYTLPVYIIWLGRHPRTAIRTSVWHYIKQFTGTCKVFAFVNNSSFYLLLLTAYIGVY